MLNPTRYIRDGIKAAFAANGITEPVWEERVPKNVIPVPKKYILLTSPTLQQRSLSKSGFEWSPTINIDVNLVREQGYTSGNELDELVERILNAMDALQVPNFTIKDAFHSLVNMQSLPLETDTASIQRRILTYQIWLNNA